MTEESMRWGIEEDTYIPVFFQSTNGSLKHKVSLSFDLLWSHIFNWQSNLRWQYLVKGQGKSHYIEGETFLWNRKWDLGWFWASLQYWKKLGANYEQQRVVFPCFQGQKNNFLGPNFFFFFLNIVPSALKSCIKWRWENKKKSLRFSYKF